MLIEEFTLCGSRFNSFFYFHAQIHFLIPVVMPLPVIYKYLKDLLIFFIFFWIMLYYLKQFVHEYLLPNKYLSYLNRKKNCKILGTNKAIGHC